jgi:hypothetical protein
MLFSKNNECEIFILKAGFVAKFSLWLDFRVMRKQETPRSIELDGPG